MCSRYTAFRRQFYLFVDGRETLCVIVKGKVVKLTVLSNDFDNSPFDITRRELAF